MNREHFYPYRAVKLTKSGDFSIWSFNKIAQRIMMTKWSRRDNNNDRRVTLSIERNCLTPQTNKHTKKKILWWWEMRHKNKNLCFKRIHFYFDLWTHVRTWEKLAGCTLSIKFLFGMLIKIGCSFIGVQSHKIAS